MYPQNSPEMSHHNFTDLKFISEIFQIMLKYNRIMFVSGTNIYKHALIAAKNTLIFIVVFLLSFFFLHNYDMPEGKKIIFIS